MSMKVTRAFYLVTIAYTLQCRVQISQDITFLKCKNHPRIISFLPKNLRGNRSISFGATRHRHTKPSNINILLLNRGSKPLKTHQDSPLFIAVNLANDSWMHLLWPRVQAKCKMACRVRLTVAVSSSITSNPSSLITCSMLFNTNS